MIKVQGSGGGGRDGSSGGALEDLLGGDSSGGDSSGGDSSGGGSSGGGSSGGSSGNGSAGSYESALAQGKVIDAGVVTVTAKRLTGDPFVFPVPMQPFGIPEPGTPLFTPGGGGTTSRGTPRQIGQVKPGYFNDAAIKNNGGQAKDLFYDGAIIGADGRVYAPGTDARAVAAFRPAPGSRKPTGETIYYVNGIMTNAAGQAGSAQKIANATGANVVAFHNSTQGMAVDLAQCLADKLGAHAPNAATEALASQIVKDIEEGKPVHLMAHSQGAIVTSNALQQVKEDLIQKYGKAGADTRLSKVQVETFGGAAAAYPYGPQYVHYINRYDPVPMGVGLGEQSASGNSSVTGGDRATLHYIEGDARDPSDPLSPHDFNQGYLGHRQEFGEAHSNNATLTGVTPVGPQGRPGAVQPSTAQSLLSYFSNAVVLLTKLAREVPSVFNEVNDDTAEMIYNTFNKGRFNVNRR